MGESSHYPDALQELLDGRLDAERERTLRSHLDGCPECRRELAALGWVRSLLAAKTEEAELPPELERSVREALGREERTWRPSRRSFLAAAAGLLLAAGGAAWLARRSRANVPEAMARDYRLFRAGTLPLEVQTDQPAQVEAFLRERGITFRTRVLDLSMMGYRVQGGRVHRLDERTSAFFVYRDEAGRVLVCQMYPGRLEQLPAATEVRTHRGFRFQIYRHGSVTTVFWQEGEVVCALAGDFAAEEIVALAFEKAML